MPARAPGVVCETPDLVSALLCFSGAGLGCVVPEAGEVLCSAAGAEGWKTAGGCCWSERTVPATVARPLHDDGGS